MFDSIDLSKKLSPEEHDRVMPDLRKRLGELQRKAKDLKIPVIIVFEGAHASGKGELINRLILPLSPDSFDVFAIEEPDEAESQRPFFWRFWVRTPARGRIAVFSHSWYDRTLEDRQDKKKDRLQPESIDEISSFEQELSDDGYIFIKFFLLISKKEQKERFKKLENDPATAWLITDPRREAHKKYDEYLEDMERLIEKTDNGNAPWTIVEAEDRRFAEAKIIKRTIEAFEEVVAKYTNKRDVRAGKDAVIANKARPGPTLLDGVDLSKSLSDEQFHVELKKNQATLRDYQCKAYRKNIPIIVVFEGWDAAGKDGDIKRLTESLDPRRYTVVPISVPTQEELNHNYLWRFWRKMPENGRFTIFDRSWYGRVLVERVEGLCSKDEWDRAYGEINEMEKQLVNSGAVLVKFWLQIDTDTQFQRLKARETDPDKQWKISEDDWRNRSKWDQYLVAVEEMLRRTSTDYASWTLVESNDKNYSRLKTLKTVIQALEEQMGPINRNGQ